MYNTKEYLPVFVTDYTVNPTIEIANKCGGIQEYGKRPKRDLRGNVHQTPVCLGCKMSH